MYINEHTLHIMSEDKPTPKNKGGRPKGSKNKPKLKPRKKPIRCNMVGPAPQDPNKSRNTKMESRLFKLSSPAATNKVAAWLAHGYQHKDIAERMNVSESAINHFAQRNVDLIQECQLRFLDVIPTAVDTAIQLIEDYNDKKTRKSMSPTILKHAHTHTVEALRSAGIYPQAGPTPQMILNLTKNEQTNIQSLNVPVEQLHNKIMELLN